MVLQHLRHSRCRSHTVTAYRLLGRPKEIATYPPGIHQAVHVRLKTSDEWTYAQVLLTRQYSLRLSFSPCVIIDAGATIGTASIFFANTYPGAKIIAVEPEASNFELLRRNVKPYDNVIPLGAALWNRDGEISVGSPGIGAGVSGNWAFVTQEHRAGAQVRAITMEALMAEMAIGRIDLLKVDIEGAEIEVFERAAWVDKVRCVVIELHDRFRPGCDDTVSSILQGFLRSDSGEVTFFARSGLDANGAESQSEQTNK